MQWALGVSFMYRNRQNFIWKELRKLKNNGDSHILDHKHRCLCGRIIVYENLIKIDLPS
jgi:hypothetical protein